MQKENLDTSIRYNLDELTLDGKNIRIRGWIVDTDGENLLEISDECGNVFNEGLQRVMRRDVSDAFGLTTEAPLGFVFTMPRREFHGEKLVLNMKNKYGVKKHEISMKQFDYENSKRGKLRKVLSRERFSENRQILKKRGFHGFVDYIQEETQSEEERYMAWLKKRRVSKQELRRQKGTRFACEPLISIVVPLYNTKQECLRELLESIMAQSYGKFELCLADGSTIKGPGAFVKKYYGQDTRVRYKHLKIHDGVVGIINEVIKMAVGDFILFMDQEGKMEPNALYELVKALNEDTARDIIYTDEDLTDVKAGHFHSPSFKPDFNIDFLRSLNYIGHSFMVRRSIANEAGLFRKEYEGAQYLDFILRCVEKTERIHHIPKVLYHWNAHEEAGDGAQESRMKAAEAGKLALSEHYARLGYEAEVEYTGNFSIYKTRFKVKDEPLVSVLIPNKDYVQTLSNCLESVFAKTDYPNYEIVIIENNSTEEETFEYYEALKQEHKNVKVINYKGSFNYSAINNLGVQAAKGDYLLFLNNDIEVISPQWMSEMLGYCQREDTAVVGAKLYYPDNTVQHAGVVIGIGNFAGHVQAMRTRLDHGYLGRLKAVQNISAVTAACMMMKRSVFEDVGGFDEEFVVSLNDVDLCLKARAQGMLVVFDPNVELYHYESKSRGLENTPEKQERFKKEIQRFRKKWQDILEKGDPYYSPNLTLLNGECTLRKEGELFPGEKS